MRKKRHIRGKITKNDDAKRAASGANRALKIKVKTAKGRKISSTRWLNRQLNDPYVAEAKRLGYRSRAAFKLIEMNDKYKFIQPGSFVIDLGAAPGGWSQIAADIVGVNRDKGKGRVLAVDLNEIEAITGVDFIHGDFLDLDVQSVIRSKFINGSVDAVISDMAAQATGHKQTDHMRIMALCENALDFSYDLLKVGGSFCAKVLKGGTEKELLEKMKQYFREVKHVKPNSSRANSAELYVLAIGFKGIEKKDNL